MQMGAALATGIDIDPQAITSASENLLLNGLHSNQMPVFLVPMNAQPSSFWNAVDKSEENKLFNNPDLKSSRGTYDVVAANILLNPLLELVEDIVGYAKPGGVVAISGILEEQVKEFNIIFLTFSCLPEFICLFICFFLYFLSHNSGAKSQRRLLIILGQHIGIWNGWMGLSSGNEEGVVANFFSPPQSKYLWAYNFSDHHESLSSRIRNFILTSWHFLVGLLEYQRVNVLDDYSLLSICSLWWIKYVWSDNHTTFTSHWSLHV